MMKNKSCSLLLALAGVALTSSQAAAVEFGAFSDVKFSKSNADGATSAFAIGGLDLYATQKIDANTTAFVEYVFEDADGFVIDVERLWVKRRISDAFQIGAGRFHSPLGFWNRNYHHGVLIQDTVSRPFFLDFEDGEAGILPMHVIGLMADGNLNGNFSYEASIGNSSSIDSAASLNASTPGNGVEIGVGNTSDYSNNKSLFGRLTYKADKLPMSVSVFGMKNSVVEAGDTGGDSNFGSMNQGDELVAQTVFGADLRYVRGDFDLLSEYYNIKNDSQLTGIGSHSATAYYLQFGYRPVEKFKAVYRYATLTFDAGTDTYFNLLNTQEAKHHVVALRYDLDDSNALTLELNRADPKAAGAKSTTTTTLDWAFMLF